MPAPKPWFFELREDNSIRIMYSNGGKQPTEAKSGGGKPRGPITSIGSGAELAKAGTAANIKVGLISVSIFEIILKALLTVACKI